MTVLGGQAVARSSLRLGPMLAEGGEGRVYELPDRPGVLYKQHRQPLPGDTVARLVAWPETSLTDPAMRSRLRAASAWPTAAVTDGGATVGLLMPRAPRRFMVRHRDGVARLATLSYLTADPARRSAAYGIALPAQVDPQRIAVVYALARVLEAMEAGAPTVVHGDLSAKNVLWSVAQGPQVYLLDLDNGGFHDPDGAAVGDERRRAMTPNWDDPAATGNPGAGTDRYSLGLIFLRLVGAAHFPVQKRQREGEAVDVEFDVPAGLLRAATLAPDAPIWSLASRSLSVVDVAARPPASTWAAALGDVLVDLGATALRDAVHVAQGSAAPSIPGAPVVGPPAPDVVVRPRAARPRSQAWTRAQVVARQPAGSGIGLAGRVGPAPGRPAGPVATAAPLGSVRVVTQPPPPVTATLRRGFEQGLSTWLDLHRRTLRRARAHQGGVAFRVAALAFIDFALACVLLLLVAMIASPFLGI